MFHLVFKIKSLIQAKLEIKRAIVTAKESLALSSKSRKITKMNKDSLEI